MIIWLFIVPTNIIGIRGEPTVLEGDNLQLICEASSHVEPNITWTKEKPGNQGNIGVVQVGKVLNITNINRSHAGAFTCTAYNGFCKPENQTIYVNVTCKYALKTTVTNVKQRYTLGFNVLCCQLLVFIKTITKFLNMLGYHQPDLSTNRKVCMLCLCKWTECVLCTCCCLTFHLFYETYKFFLKVCHSFG